MGIMGNIIIILFIIVLAVMVYDITRKSNLSIKDQFIIFIQKYYDIIMSFFRKK